MDPQVVAALLVLWPRKLYDLRRANQRVVNYTLSPIERAVLSIRCRLAAQVTPQTRYSLVSATTIHEELKSLGLSPPPSLRTIERLLAWADLTCPPLWLVRRLA